MWKNEQLELACKKEKVRVDMEKRDQVDVEKETVRMDVENQIFKVEKKRQ